MKTVTNILNLLESLPQDQTELIELEIAKLYESKFPKKCSSCSNVFHNREEYLKGTKVISSPDAEYGTIKDLGSIWEYRNCKCGSTLVIQFKDRRDQTSFGKERRELFTKCVNSLVKKHAIQEKEAVLLMRSIFREKIKKISFKKAA